MVAVVLLAKAAAKEAADAEAAASVSSLVAAAGPVVPLVVARPVVHRAGLEAAVDTEASAVAPLVAAALAPAAKEVAATWEKAPEPYSLFMAMGISTSAAFAIRGL